MIIVLALLLSQGTAYVELIVTPTQLLASPASLDCQHVGVTGTVENLEMKTSQRGSDYKTFNLCDKACVKVFAWGRPSLRDGQSETVHGTFVRAKARSSSTYYNKIEADDTWAKDCCSDHRW